MKKTLLTLILVLAAGSANAQVFDAKAFRTLTDAPVEIKTDTAVHATTIEVTDTKTYDKAKYLKRLQDRLKSNSLRRDKLDAQIEKDKGLLDNLNQVKGE